MRILTSGLFTNKLSSLIIPLAQFRIYRKYLQLKVHHRCQRYRRQTDYRCQPRRWVIQLFRRMTSTAGTNDVAGKIIQNEKYFILQYTILYNIHGYAAT